MIFIRSLYPVNQLRLTYREYELLSVINPAATEIKSLRNNTEVFLHAGKDREYVGHGFRFFSLQVVNYWRLFECSRSTIFIDKPIVFKLQL